MLGGMNPTMCDTCGNLLTPDLRSYSGRHRNGDRKWRKVCKPCRNAARPPRPRSERSERENTYHRRQRWTKFGPAAADYIDANMGRPCHICGEPSTDADHDHETGVFRGLLCRHCNLALGHFRDRPELLRTAADYVEAPPGVTSHP